MGKKYRVVARGHVLNGKTGTCKAIEKGCIGLEMDEDPGFGHNLCGFLTTLTNGWWFEKDEVIELVEIKASSINVNDLSPISNY